MIQLSSSIIFLLMVTLLVIINLSTKGNIYSDINKLPYNRVGLIPGCNKYIARGVINGYYSQRIKAGINLYKSGKIDYILVSGDNAHRSYDEPREMMNSLIEGGIPKNRIYADYAGFRTLDTVVRAKEVFQQSRVTFISQDFHNQRGVFIGKSRGIDIVAYNAGTIPTRYGFKTEVREIFAKYKMLIDIYITNKEPKFLGDKIKIGEVTPLLEE